MTDTTPRQVAVLVVDDHAAFRVAAASVLGRVHEFDLVGEASDGAEAIELTGTLRPHLVLMDVRMPGTDGITAARVILERWPDTRIVLCSTYDLSDAAAQTAEDPRIAYVAKEELGPATLRELWRALTA